ncbi:MAG TPA: hypothetical protein VF517_07920 [Thermoleophilaceae bacterium]|jgi:hypothetical protein
MGAGLAGERGDPLGLVAMAFYGVLFVVGALRWDELVAWGKEHPVADRIVLAPLVFFAAALVTDLPLAVCGVIAVIAAAALVLVDLGRRRGTAT